MQWLGNARRLAGAAGFLRSGAKAAVLLLGCQFFAVEGASAANPTCTSGATPCFELLGTLPGHGAGHGDPLSYPHAISADGNVVVGVATNSDNVGEPFRWVGGTMTGLGRIPDAAHGVCTAYTCAEAFAVNSDGTVVVGMGFVNDGAADPSGRAWFWNGGSLTPLDMLAVCNPHAGRDGSKSYGVSADGTVIVGGYSCDFGTAHPFRAVNGAMVDLGTLGSMNTEAMAVSADGSVVAGTAHTTCCNQAFRSAGGGAPVALSSLPDDTGGSGATAISGDGTVIFGWSEATQGGTRRPVRWVNSVIERIGDSGNALMSANADGTVGVSSARWSVTGGYTNLEHLLPAWGMTFSPGQGFSATAISADGITIVGTTGSGSLATQGFIARIPLEPNAPAAISAAAIGAHAFTARWAAAASATGYRLDVASDSGFTNLLSGYNNLDVGNVQSANVTGLNPDTTYYYRVRASNPTGPSANSSPISAKTLATHATTLALAATPSGTKPGQAVQLKATVTVKAPASGTPTGTVTFKEGSTTLGSTALSSGQGMISTGALTIGVHTIVASYGGAGVYLASSGHTTVTVSAGLTAQARSNKTTTGAQQYPAIAKLKSGYFVAWASNGQDTSGYGIYGQRYTESGNKVGSADIHVSTAKTGSQTLPQVGGLKAGGFIVTWQADSQDGSSSGIYAQNFNATGGKVGKEFKVNKTTAGAQSGPAIVPLSGGGFVIAWTSNGQDKSGLGIYAQRYDGSAKPVGTEFKVNKTTSGAQSMPTIAALTNGGFMIAWQSDGQDQSGLGIYGQRYDKNGKPVGSEFKINKTTTGAQSIPSAVGTSDGGFVVTFQGPDSSGLGVYARRYTSSGSTSGSDVRVNTTTEHDQSQPSVTAFSDGGYAVLWTSASQDGSGKGVYAQVYKSTGAKANVEFLVNTTTNGDQSQPAAAGASSGTFMAAWTSRNASPSFEDVYTARFNVPLQAFADYSRRPSVPKNGNGPENSPIGTLCVTSSPKPSPANQACR